ncbi:MAG: hypoxanthine phosphoribosyltransferase [Bacteroides sp.]|nr:hypoxanthine phosphoribosyltransferase [Bacteroides sp.]MCM1085119.1 hypoxanthine phosphoribosyltransferase [Bacteroides sp.]
MDKGIIRIKDKDFKPYLPARELDRIIGELAEKINRDYAGRSPLLLPVLNGAFIFAADLVKKIKLPCRISLVKMSSYSGLESTNKVQDLIGLQEDISGQDVIIIEDIVDTGVTMAHMLDMLKEKNPKSVAICSLFFKPEKFTKDYPVQYIGKSIPNDFVVGYGFDYDGFGRNLPDIYSIVE